MPLSRADIEQIYQQGLEAVVALVEQLQAAPPPPLSDPLLADLHTQLLAHQQTVATLTARVQALEDRLARTSHNSHQPPSADGFAKAPRSLRTRSGKKPGGQPGHPGHTLEFTAHPDQIVCHRPTACAHCGYALTAVPACARQARQVVDLPPLHLQTVEHQVETLCCPHCQQRTSGVFPAVAAQPVQYGPHLLALALYLTTYQLLPYARTRDLLHDLFGAAPSAGTLYTAQQTAAAQLRPVEATIQAAVRAAPVAHFDETGVRVAGQRQWVHVASTAQWTYYYWHRQRGQGGMTAAGVLPHFHGIAVHDCWAPLLTYGCAHALCNAHLLRELLFLAERHGQPWAGTLQTVLREMKAAVDAAAQAGAAPVSADAAAALRQRYEQIVAQGLTANPVQTRPNGQPRGKVKQSKATNLLLRLQSYEAEVLRFLHDERVPFDNNQAERDLRMLKVQQKIAGGFRSAAGATAFCRLRGYISTLRKQGHNVRTALEQTLRGTPFVPQVIG